MTTPKLLSEEELAVYRKLAEENIGYGELLEHCDALAAEVRRLRSKNSKLAGHAAKLETMYSNPEWRGGLQALDDALGEIKIAAAHPTRTGRHDLYAEAMRLVGARRSKGGLVALVNWLLHRVDAADAERDTLKAENKRLEAENSKQLAEIERWHECVDDIADALGDETEWSNLNDRGDNAINLAHELRRAQEAAEAQLATKDAALLLGAETLEHIAERDYPKADHHRDDCPGDPMPGNEHFLCKDCREDAELDRIINACRAALTEKEGER